MRKRFPILSGAVLLSAYLMTSDLTIAHAGGINANEQAVVNAVSGVFEYEGRKYRAHDSYIELAREYLSMDEYDLTKEQCDQVIANVYANVAAGIADGYLYEVTEEKAGTESQTGEAAADTEQKDSEPKEQDTPESTDNIPEEKTENIKESTEVTDGKEEQYQEAISELLPEIKETSTGSIIKRTGFSLKGTALTGAALLAALITNLIFAAGIRRK